MYEARGPDKGLAELPALSPKSIDREILVTQSWFIHISAVFDEIHPYSLDHLDWHQSTKMHIITFTILF